MNSAGPIQPAKPLKAWELLALFALGAWLLAGGWVSIAERKWAWFMPAQLDFIGVLGTFTSEKWAAYLGGGVILVIGATLAIVAVLAAVRQHAD